jgi:hypothetical protein
MRISTRFLAAPLLGLALASPASADQLLFDSGTPDGKMAMASRPGLAGKVEIEAADDFVVPSSFTINSATFTGVIVGATPTFGQVNVEIYRVFPLDSTTPPDGRVPTRNNSPSDVELLGRGTNTGDLTFTTSTLNSNFTAGNSVLNGINPVPNQTTMGEGPVTGTEVRFNVTFTTPITLPADHYFFVPQVHVTGGEFYWLSSPRPITTGFAFSPDLQTWIRNANLDPDWLRVGTDIEGQGRMFNASFSLSGVPEPSSLALSACGGAVLLAAARRRRRRS